MPIANAIDTEDCTVSPLEDDHSWHAHVQIISAIDIDACIMSSLSWHAQVLRICDNAIDIGGRIMSPTTWHA